MKRRSIFIPSLFISLFFTQVIVSQESIPLDTLHWKIEAKSYVLETYKDQASIYLQRGAITLKDETFLNGTIEYDIHLRENVRGFPGVHFRVNDANAEEFYIRPHQSGNPDANQATPITNGITPWQFYFGPKYSFPYHYKFDDWTHVKLVVNNDRAQVFLDYSDTPNLSWKLFHKVKAGEIRLTGGGNQALHIANISIDKEKDTLKDFMPIERKPIEGLIPNWEISDKFEESLLVDHTKLNDVIESRTWEKEIVVEEGTAANISRKVELRDGKPGNTVFAKITIHSDRPQTKLFDFGYSDRVMAILNGQPIYKGTNNFRSRDYRYLGTIGLFDAIYLDLKKGKNTLLMAVSEDFGGWLITGKFQDNSGIKIK
ncbi:hypothetical protein [Flagellimonas eckloniae]|uniref:3-keto-disaccharide hydrolase domain-containing protein n=1 Tax=Flagellimonas eckloniae TaxID=346185 RepID=A0A0Q1DJU4_9FLAO|nr:hypothetical protein [Allomuricauda eckloniae]KQC29081.1 hypothetical protein AAY42_03580 [Allomuricauda eckloniae]